MATFKAVIRTKILSLNDRSFCWRRQNDLYLFRRLLTHGFMVICFPCVIFAKPSLPSEKSDNERDMENLQTDWMNIGKYIHNACEKFKTEHQ
ncbi:MAG: hypothetical protein LBG28_02425 [Tannerella sp.]|jgi:hypothetical protein|nr:hypothetical protein [Tannerella sp.]